MASPQLENGYVKIANEIFEALARIRINGEARQVLDTILRKTYGFNKKIDAISLSQFVLATGLKKNAICKGIGKLKEINIITQKENAIAKEYGLNKDFDTWKPLPKKRTNKVLPKKRITLPQKENNRTPKRVPQKTVTKDTITKDNEVSDFFSYFLSKTKRNFQLTKDNKRLIKSRLDNGRTILELKKAVDNFMQDEWSGRSSRLDLVYCIGTRSGVDNLEKWLNYKPKKKIFERKLYE